MREFPKPDYGAPPWRRSTLDLAARLPAGLPLDWEDRSFLALDFETTGLHSRSDRVVEIGAIRFRCRANPAESGGRNGIEALIEGAMESLVSPGIAMPAAAFAIHGIGDEELANAPAFGELAFPLLALAKEAIVIAHNAPFDLSFLRSELARVPGAEAAMPAESLDTRDLAKSSMPGRPSYRLQDLASFLGLDVGRSHRALDDARTCLELFLHCAFLLSRPPRYSGGGA